MIQGYFESPQPDGVGPCAEVLVSGVRWPAGGRANAPGTAPPATRDDAAAWEVCDLGEGSYRWSRWVHGGYYELLGFYGDYGAEDRPYSAVRPASDFAAVQTYLDELDAFAFDYPRLWDLNGAPVTTEWGVKVESYDWDCVTNPGGPPPPGGTWIEVDRVPGWRGRSPADVVSELTGHAVRVRSEEPWELAGGTPAVRLEVTDEWGIDAFWLIAVFDGGGVMMHGRGDAGAFDAVARTLRAVGIATPTP